MQESDLIKEGLGLAAWGISRRKIQVKGEIPGIEVLEAEFDRIYSPKHTPEIEELSNISEKENQGQPVASQDESGEIKQKGTACIPCSVSHLTACVGELNEAVRFAREDVGSLEVTKRVDHCLSEITACERIDLAPENVVNLSPTEKAIANNLATEIREIRHGLEWYKSKEELEELAAKTAELQHSVSHEWVKARLSNMSPEEKARISQKAQEILSNPVTPVDITQGVIKKGGKLIANPDNIPAAKAFVAELRKRAAEAEAKALATTESKARILRQNARAGILDANRIESTIPIGGE